MSYVIAAPEALVAAATDLATRLDDRRRQHGRCGLDNGVADRRRRRSVGGDSGLFGMHGQTYQALSARAAAFHERFVQALATGGAPMRPPRPPASRRCRARSIC